MLEVYEDPNKEESTINEDPNKEESTINEDPNKKETPISRSHYFAWETHLIKYNASHINAAFNLNKP